MYLTLYKQSKTNITDIDYNNIMQADIAPPEISYYKTTVHIEHPAPLENLNTKQQQQLNSIGISILKAWGILHPFENNYEEQYYEFKIPKRSGGLRTIDAPKPEFKEALSRVKDIFEREIKCLAHNSAYAYTKQRSVLDAMKIHQANSSNWYLKIDLTNFFPSCTPELIFHQLKQLYPFYYLDQGIDMALKNIIKVCCLHGGLPQGTPMSPLLTNLIMVPYDYTITNYLKRGNGNHFVYTRYADDILISSKANFNWLELQKTLQTILLPFQIKKAKTRYGSKAGSNWNLGLMLNKDNKITVGASKKRLINAMLNNFIRDYTNSIEWSRDDTQQLQGQLSYLHQIEPEYHDHIIQKYQTKYNANYKTILKEILN